MRTWCFCSHVSVRIFSQNNEKKINLWESYFSLGIKGYKKNQNFN